MNKEENENLIFVNKTKQTDKKEIKHEDITEHKLCIKDKNVENLIVDGLKEESKALLIN